MARRPMGAAEADAPPAAPVAEVTITRQARTHAPDPRIPAHVWDILQECGEKAAIRLKELLEDTVEWKKIRPNSQAALIKLAFGYAYGKEAAPAKETVSATLSGEDSDAVSAVLDRLSGSAVLPEYKVVSPVEGEVH